MITSERVEHCAHILVYDDDIRILDKRLERFMQILKRKYTVKTTSIGEMNVYKPGKLS